MWGNYLYFVTPDDYFVSLDARTGKERWHKEAAPFSQQYFMTSAPMTSATTSSSARETISIRPAT
jgi:PQQ enzyme repeat.